MVGAQKYSSLDLAQGFHKFIVLDKGALKMALRTLFGHYHF